MIQTEYDSQNFEAQKFFSEKDSNNKWKLGFQLYRFVL